MLSYWEQQSFTSYNHIIVGSGIVGLSTAIELRERFPKARIAVLERGLLPTGATTRNAGFACMGSATELLGDLETHTEAEVISLFMRRYRGLQKLRARLGDAAIRYDRAGGYELLRGEETGAMDKLEYLNNLLLPHLGEPTFEDGTDKLIQFEFNRNKVKALIHNRLEAGIHSGELVRSLADMAMAKGIEIRTGAVVAAFAEEEKCVAVTVEDGFRSNQLILKADTVTICTNAFARDLFPEVDVTPGRGQIFMTEPVADLPFKGIFHLEQGFYYFRELDGRVLFGGGRNLDFEGERTTAFELSQLIQDHLEEKLRDLILPDHPFKIAQRWSGIMAFGAVRAPIVQCYSHRVYKAFRMGGMGVALGSEIAAEVAGMIAETH